MDRYRQKPRKTAAVANVRLLPAGTRVVIIKMNSPEVAGVISAVRTETQLRPYVITCDDGVTRYGSAYDLVLEGDQARAPLGIRPEA